MTNSLYGINTTGDYFVIKIVSSVLRTIEIHYSDFSLKMHLHLRIKEDREYLSCQTP